MADGGPHPHLHRCFVPGKTLSLLSQGVGEHCEAEGPHPQAGRAEDAPQGPAFGPLQVLRGVQGLCTELKSSKSELFEKGIKMPV